MYLAEFSLPDTSELVTELLINAPSEGIAREVAQQHAEQLEVELFSFTPATEQQIRLYRLMGKSINAVAI